jgi:hypothetical protein
MGLNLQVHKYERIKGTQDVRLVKTSPYTVVKGAAEEVPVYIQGGVYYSAGGDRIKKSDLPDWVHEEVGKMSVKAKEEVGLKKTEDK